MGHNGTQGFHLVFHFPIFSPENNVFSRLYECIIGSVGATSVLAAEGERKPRDISWF